MDMTTKRLKSLLYNAIGALEDLENWEREEVLKELGITAEEYWHIMYDDWDKAEN